tara:strand:- start:227 stop:643 length:417 start_codon:yes stop_codon:yes gene_type:complete
MLGGGNPVGGSNPAGTGSSINYIRTEKKILAYAYSGEIVIPAGTAAPDTTLLKFATGNETIDGTIMVGLDNQGAPTVGLEAIINGEVVYSIKFDAGGPASFIADTPLYLLIPPYSNFEFKVGLNDNQPMTAALRGLVY